MAVRAALLLAGLLAVTGAAAIGGRRPAGRRRRPTIPSSGSRRSRASGRWPGRAARTRARSATLQGDPRYQANYDRALDDPRRRATASRRSPSAPTASTISGRTATMSAASSGARRWPATAPTRPNGRRCSTSTRWPRTEDANLGLSGHAAACRPRSGAAWSSSPTAAATPMSCASSTSRERRFVEGGFCLPEGKQSVTWEDENTLLVARDWGPGTMTASGYPFVVKRLRRGQTLDRGRGSVSRPARGRARRAVRAARQRRPRPRRRRLSRHRLLPQRVHPVPPPAATSTLPIPHRASLAGIVDGRLLVTLDEPWEAAPGLRFRRRFDRLLRSRRMEARSAAAPGRAWSGRRGRARR